MGVEDMAKQAGDFISQNSDKINEALKSEQAEAVSDKVLDGVAGLADKVTGGNGERDVFKGLDFFAGGLLIGIAQVFDLNCHSSSTSSSSVSGQFFK